MFFVSLSFCFVIHTLLLILFLFFFFWQHFQIVWIERAWKFSSLVCLEDRSWSCGENNFAGLNAKPISQSIYEWINRSSSRSVDQTDHLWSTNRSISTNPLIGQSVHRWTLHSMNRVSMNRSIDQSRNSMLHQQSFDKSTTHRSIKWAIDPSINRSIVGTIHLSI